MDGQSSGNQPPPDPIAQPAAVKLPDDIVRQQQVLRRHLQDPASPAFNNPVRAAELAGLAVIRESRVDPDPESRPTYFYSSTYSDKSFRIRQEILDAASRKTSTIENLRRRVSEGMEATKFVTMRDREGSRRSVEVPDQPARREWAQLCARLENLLPGKGGNPNSDMLPHDAAKAVQLERTLDSDIEHMNPAERFLVYQYFQKIEHYEDLIRRQAIAAKLGKSVEEFEYEVDHEVRSEMKQFLSGLDPKPATSCDNSQIATEGKP